VQQRAGVHLKGGLGEAGDAYEQHADAVAARVVAGESAADLLGPVAGPAASVQRGGIQRQRWPGDPPDPATLAEARRALREAEEIAKDLVEEVRGGRQSDLRQKPRRETRKLKAKLREIANRSPAGSDDPVAERATNLLGQIEDLENEQRALQIDRQRALGEKKGNERLAERVRGSAETVDHAATGQAKGQAAEAGAQLLLSLQLGNVRADELAKAEARFQQLVPEIERLRREGYGVVVTVEAEVPTSPDVAAAATGVGDADQVVYFHSMYIKSAMKPLRAPVAGEVPQTSMSPVGGVQKGFGNPNRTDDPHDLTLGQQIRAQMGDPDPAGKHQPKHPGHRIITRDQTFAASGSTSTPAQPFVMRPGKMLRTATIGRDYSIQDNRWITADTSAPLGAFWVLGMWNTKVSFPYRGSVGGAGRALTFTFDVPGHKHSITATFEDFDGTEVTEIADYELLDDDGRPIARASGAVRWVRAE
jgi:hypothetical protein